MHTHTHTLNCSKTETMWQGFINLFSSQASFAQQRPQFSIWHWFLLICVEQAVWGVQEHGARCATRLPCLQWQTHALWWNTEANQHNGSCVKELLYWVPYEINSINMRQNETKSGGILSGEVEKKCKSAQLVDFSHRRKQRHVLP